MDNNNEKMTSFIKQYGYSIIFFAIITLNVASAFIPFIKYVSIALFIFSCFYYDVNKNIGLIFLFLFTEIIPYTTESDIFAFVSIPIIFAIFCIISLIKTKLKNEITFKKSLYVPLSMCGIIFLLTIFVPNPAQFTVVSLRYVAILLFILAIYLLRKQFNISEIFRYFYTALFVSCIFSAIFILPNESGIICYHKDEFDYFRFKALVGHENTLYVYALTSIAIGMFLYYKKEVGLTEFLSISAISALIGVSTCSKTFIIIMALLLLIFIFCSFFKKSKKFLLTEFFLLAGGFALVFIVLKDDAIALFDRFFLYFTEGNWINMVTTGRYDIWVRFYNMWTENALTVIFGIGASYNLVDYTHCVYLELLSKFGIVGFTAIIIFIGYLFTVTNKKRLKFINFIPIITLGCIMFVDEFISSKIITIILAMLCIYDAEDLNQPSHKIYFVKKQNIENNQLINEKQRKKQIKSSNN